MSEILEPTLQPFLKWAGGKRWLVAGNELPVPHQFDRLVEPFLGSGAVFFHLRPQKAHLTDLNEDLINLYKQIRFRPLKFSESLKTHQANHSKQYYYEIREWEPKDKLDRAARFLYLNRTCWNGLYRVNLNGKFNVPIGTKNRVIFDDDNFLAVSKLLKRAKISCLDFEKVIDESTYGDFLFVDPPYTVRHNYNGFLKYNERIFSWDDQIRLKQALLRAKQRGVAFVMTNADHSSIQELYKNVGEQIQLSRRSVLAGNRLHRGMTTESLYFGNI